MHRNNDKPTIPIGYSTMKKNRETIENMLLLLQYNEYQWVVMGNLKVVNILMGLKFGYSTVWNKLIASAVKICENIEMFILSSTHGDTNRNTQQNLSC